MQYRRNLLTYTKNGLRELYDNPGSYLYHSVKDIVTDLPGFVKEYWDVAAITAGIFAFGDYNDQIFGGLRAPLMLTGLFSAFAGTFFSSTHAARGTRSARNITFGMGGLFYLSQTYNPHWSAWIVKAAALGMIVTAAEHDKERIHEETPRKKQASLEVVLQDAA